MSDWQKLYEQQVINVRDALNQIAESAYEYGRLDENADIINYLKQQADKLEATRPEPYKNVLPALDIEIFTIRKIVQHLELKLSDD